MAQDISQLLECQICSEPFDELERKPKMLPCRHTFCLHCVEQMAYRPTCKITWAPRRSTYYRVKTKLKCPNDNKVFDIPDDSDRDTDKVNGKDRDREDRPTLRNVFTHPGAPVADVANFPNDLTMMSLLSFATGRNKLESPQYDITKVLIRRVKYLRREITSLKADLDKVPLSSDLEVEKAKKSICKSFQETKKQFIEAIDEKQAILMAEMDSFSEKRRTERNEQVTIQFKKADEFCDKVERELPELTERIAIQYLNRCLEMKETTKYLFGKLQSFENTDYEVKFNLSTDSTVRKQNIEQVILSGGQLTLKERPK